MAINRLKILEKLKRSRGIMDDEQDELLNDIIEDTIAHYLAIANRLSDERVIEVDENHAFIITDVSSKRYVRRGSEGMEREAVDGYQATYANPESDFKPYLDLIEDVYHKGDASEGRMTFY